MAPPSNEQRNLQTILIEHGETIGRIDERTKIMRDEQVAQTEILTDVTGRVKVVETKQKAADKTKRRWYTALIVVGIGALGWIAQIVAEAVLAAWVSS